MSSLTAIFGNSEEKTEDSDKLLELYWNRAELKKEFADMRKEQYRLQDRIKEQEGRAARLQQKLKHLEGLTFVEVGERLAMSTNTAKTHYYRGLRRLRAMLGQLTTEDGST